MFLPGRQWAMVRQVLHTNSIGPQPSLCLQPPVIFLIPSSKAPLPTHHDLERKITDILIAFYFTFWRPGNLNFDLLSASSTLGRCCSLVRMDMMGCPMCTRATVPCGLPNAPRIPVWSLHHNLRSHTKWPPIPVSSCT